MEIFKLAVGFTILTTLLLISITVLAAMLFSTDGMSDWRDDDVA